LHFVFGQEFEKQRGKPIFSMISSRSWYRVVLNELHVVLEYEPILSESFAFNFSQ